MALATFFIVTSVFSLFYAAALALIIIPEDVFAPGQQEFPEHEFISYPCKTKASKKTYVSLVSAPYVFRRQKPAKCIGKKATFQCTGCAKKGVATYAKAEWHGDFDYTLVEYPPKNQHQCFPSYVNHLKKKFADMCFGKV